MVDDDDGDEAPSPKPRTVSRSALPRGLRAWQWLHIVKCDDFFSLIFFSPGNSIYGGGVGVEEATGGPGGRGRALGGRRAPHPRGKVVGPLAFIFGRYFSYFLKSVSVKFQLIPRTFAPAHK